MIITVEFAYEYQHKGDKIYTEVVSELSEDAFGQSVESVSGYIAAPTLALANATYQSDVRNVAAYAGALLLNERRPTLAQQRLDTELNSLAALDDRYIFSFQVLRSKTASQRAVEYELSTTSDVQRLERTTMIQGEVFAENVDAASAFLDTLLTGLAVGKRVRFDRRPRYRTAPAVSGGSQATVFVGLQFSEEYVEVLTGVVNGILESECAEEIVYSGDRLVEKPIPDGASIVQKPGTTPGRRTVTARAIGTTETACRTWVKKMRTALLTGTGNPADETYESAPTVTTTFRFLKQTEGVPRGDSANVQLFEVNATFMELLPVFPFDGN